MFGFHGPELIIVLVVALLIFGPKRLPEMGSAIGKSIKSFKKGMNELNEDDSASPKNAIDQPMPISAEDLQKLSSGTFTSTITSNTEATVESHQE